MTLLHPCGDRDVVESAIRIVGAGDGLSAALELEPGELELDDGVQVVLRCTVTKAPLEPIKDSDEARRVHTLRATFGSIVDEKAARKLLDVTRKAIETASGVQRLAGVADDDE